MTGVLLDTHVWLWLVFADPQLKPKARERMEQASHDNQLRLSPISLWEVALKHSRGKLELQSPIRAWLREASDLPGMHLAPITADIAADCAALPAEFHGDPADRIIAATARCENLTLITHDKNLLRLAKSGFLHAFAT